MGQKVNPHGFRVGVIKDWVQEHTITLCPAIITAFHVLLSWR